jgi:hypothetical protein
MGLVPIFYPLRFETSLLVPSYDTQGYGGGIRPRLHTGLVAERELHILLQPGADRKQNSSLKGSSVVICMSVAMGMCVN